MCLKCCFSRYRVVAAFFLLTIFCTGCASLLERQYSSVEPHSRKFWESEAAGTLRAETYTDIVNDLLLLIGQRRESGTLRLYNFADVSDSILTLNQAAMEVQHETPMGSYAVSYITFSSHVQRGYDEVQVQIGYQRTAEQLQAIVSATSPEAVYSLLETALREGRTELAVRVGYWTPEGRNQVEQDVARLREDAGLAQTQPWIIRYYPENGQVGLIEFDLNPPATAEEQEEPGDQAGNLPAEQEVEPPDEQPVN